MIELPGGYQPGSGAPVAHSVTLSELTGVVEEELSATLSELVKSDAVSRQLSLMISRIGAYKADFNMISGLSIADRTYALAQLGVALGHPQYWHGVSCDSCDEYFDFSIDLSAISPADAPKTFPEIRIRSSLGPLVLRAPTGADQAVISGIKPDDEACAALLARCLRTKNGGDVELRRLTTSDVELIEAALDELALGIPLMATARCPSCGHDNSVPFETGAWLSLFIGALLDQVHEIARSYHWSEAEILNLSRERRLGYLHRLGYFDEAGL
jgi:hypothetical protein